MTRYVPAGVKVMRVELVSNHLEAVVVGGELAFQPHVLALALLLLGL